MLESKNQSMTWWYGWSVQSFINDPCPSKEQAIEKALERGICDKEEDGNGSEMVIYLIEGVVHQPKLSDFFVIEDVDDIIRKINAYIARVFSLDNYHSFSFDTSLRWALVENITEAINHWQSANQIDLIIPCFEKINKVECYKTGSDIFVDLKNDHIDISIPIRIFDFNHDTKKFLANHIWPDFVKYTPARSRSISEEIDNGLVRQELEQMFAMISDHMLTSNRAGYTESIKQLENMQRILEARLRVPFLISS